MRPYDLMNQPIRYIKDLAQLAGLFGLFFGLFQYARAQRWKQAEFAAKELDKLTTDPLLSLACTLLDWSGRPFETPSSYHYKLEKSTFVHCWKSLERSMHPEIAPDDSGGFSPQEVLYRDIFDHLFAYLDRLNHYVEINLVDTKDLSILSYYLEQIARPRFTDHRPIFDDFIKSFGYDGVLRLRKRLVVRLGAPEKARSKTS
jgi:hypothetical protein